MSGEHVVTTRRGLRTSERSSVLDGVRGVAILLVVLSHSWKVWPADRRGTLGSLEALFDSGSVAVSIFFVLTGFLVTRTFMSRLAAAGPAGPLAWFTGRVLRISVQVWVLLAAVSVASRLDSTDLTRPDVTESSLAAAATYTWNTYVRDNALTARSDIGALYFLCIDVQVLSAFLVAFLVLARARRALTAGVLVLLVGSSVWRALVFEQEGWFVATLTTVTRMDAILWGIAAALLADRLTSLRRHADAVLGAATLVVLGCVGSTAFWGLEAYFTVVGPLVGFGAALLVLGDSAPRPHRTYADRFWGWPPFAVLGRASLSVFLWHIPVFEAVARHTSTWHPFPRSILALAVLAVVVVVVERLVGRPVTALVGRLSAHSARRDRRAPRPTERPLVPSA